MIAFSTNGWAIFNNDWPDSPNEIQNGSFLVRSSADPVPEPAQMLPIRIMLLFAARQIRRPELQ
jgi:hypothetical protein